MMTLREIIGYDEIYIDFIEMVKSTSIMTISEQDLSIITQLSLDDDFDERLDDYAESIVRELPSVDEMWLLVEEFINVNVTEGDLQNFVSSSNVVAETLIGVGDFMSTVFKKQLNVEPNEVH